MANWWNPFDDEGGAFQGSEPGFFWNDMGIGGGSGGAPPAKRGQARGGGADPNEASFQLGWDPSGTQAIGTQAQGTAQHAQQLGGVAAQQRYDALSAGSRGTPRPDQGAAYGLLNNVQGRGQGMGQVGAEIGARADDTTGSAAQAVRAQGVNDSLNAALALAGSQGGLGGSAAAMSQAMQTAPAEIARAANEAAQLQAASDDADAARQLEALGMQGSLLGSARQGDLASADLARQLGLDLSEQQLAGMSLNDQLRLGLGQQGLGYDQMSLDAQLGAGQLGLGAQELGLQGATSSLEGRIAYEQLLNDLYGIDSGQQLGMRELDIQKGQNIMGAIGGVGSSIAGLAMLSDERAKQNAKLTNLKDRYSALGGY